MIEITEVFPFDKDVLRGIYLAGRKEINAETASDIFQLADFDAHTKGEHILVARYNGSIAGFISIWLQENFLHHLYISKEFRQKGIGTALLKAGCKLTTSKAQLKCLEKNVNAISFYKKNGFIEKSKGKSKDGDYILFDKNG